MDTPASLPDDGSHWSGNLSLGSLTGPWVGAAKCLQDHKSNKPPVPYGVKNANQNMSQLVEAGFKQVRGELTEGRHLTFEMFGLALSNIKGELTGISPATKAHDDPKQRWIIHTVGGPGAGNQFYIQSALDKKYIAGFRFMGQLTSNIKKAQAFTITYNPKGSKYSLTIASKPDTYVKLSPNAKRRSDGLSVSASINWEAGFGGFSVYSVSYST